MSNPSRKPRKRPNEPIAPATIPGQPLDPKIPPELAPGSDEERDELEDPEKSDEERQAR
jgi:hypothetical protein